MDLQSRKVFFVLDLRNLGTRSTIPTFLSTNILDNPLRTLPLGIASRNVVSSYLVRTAEHHFSDRTGKATST